MIRWSHRLLLALTFAAALAGCALVPQSEPQDIYRLPPPTISASDAETVSKSLRILTPVASGQLASRRIVVLPHGNRISGYSGSRWSSPAPVLWRDHLLEAFGNDGRIGRLSGDNEDVRAAWELGGVLRAFQSEYSNGEPRVVIEFNAKLVHERTRHIVASHEFVVSEEIAGKEVPQVIEAFGRAADTMSRRVIDWTISRLQSADSG